MPAQKKFLIKISSFLESNRNGILKYASSIYPGVAGAALIFFKDAILANSILKYVYLTSVVIWIFVYYSYIANESRINKAKNEEIKSAIFRAPNPGIFNQYLIFYQEIMVKMSLVRPIKTVYQDIISDLLQRICYFTNLFLNSDTHEIYSANIMLYIPTAAFPKIVEHLRSESAECFHFQDHQISSINGVLHLVPDLAFLNNKQNGKKVKPITLPILNIKNNRDDVTDNLPGAPRSMIEGDYIFLNTEDEKPYQDFSDKERRIAKKFWANSEVKSFISLAIPFHRNETKTELNILNSIGVLNIDSLKPDFLGMQREYYSTYHALIYPILCQLSPILTEYFNFFIKEMDEKVASS